MNQQQEARRAAAQAFRQALEQLQQSLETEPSPEPTSLPVSPGLEKQDAVPEANLNVWEDAIADIEQFMQDLAASDS